MTQEMAMNTLEQKFDVYVINMDTAQGRMQHMRNELARVGLRYVRQPGVVGAALRPPHPDFSEWSYKYLHGRKWAGRELGCYLSHVECLKRFLDSESDHALILEDDVSIDDHIVAVVHKAIESSGDWNMLRLSTVNHGRWWPIKTLSNGFSLSICLTREKGAGGYLVDRKAAAQMLKHLLPMRLAWDIAFDLEWFMSFKTLGVCPMPISQRSDFETQIQQDLGQIKIKGYSKYLTVLPFRLFLEVSRVFYRTARLLRLKNKRA